MDAHHIFIVFAHITQWKMEQYSRHITWYNTQTLYIKYIQEMEL